MIVKIDHIAFGSSDLEKDLNWFQSLGYGAQFKEKSLKDLENKRPFMHQFSGDLDMALLQRPGSLAIELLDHQHTVSQPGHLLPVMEGTVDGGEPTGDVWKMGELTAARLRNESFDFFVSENDDRAGFRCDKVIVETADIAASAEYWKVLGFKECSTNHEAAKLEYRSPFGGTGYYIYLRKTYGQMMPYQLDSRGFNCLAFFSSDAEKDRQRFMGAGMNPTAPNRFRVNGKDLSIYWLPGPHGEVAEIIGLAKS